MSEPSDSDQHGMRPLSGWAQLPVVQARTHAGEDLERITRNAVLSRGLGRAYSDAALPPDGESRVVALTPTADRILGFSSESHVMRAEAGLSLGSLREIFLSRGYFTPVSAGTRHVTLGGAVAADIHGKNHHVAGTFGDHVQRLKLRLGDGQLVECGPDLEPELFFATLGGMGLTGHILEVDLKLEKVPTGWIYEESERHPDLVSVFTALNQASEKWPMTVAWIDTTAKGKSMGRGIVMRGRWAEPHEAPQEPPAVRGGVRLPFNFPNGLANPFTFGILNSFWFRKHGRKDKKHVVHPESYFWVLDSIDEWYRVYGSRGFTQYQCVMPRSAELYREFLELFQKHGGSSFVTVFKDCGPAGRGMLSFPQEGTSLALDIPYAGEPTRALCKHLNEFVLANGGRVYLAKDAFTTGKELARMYPRLEEWMEAKQRYDPQGRIRSAQWDRLFGRGPTPALT